MVSWPYFLFALGIQVVGYLVFLKGFFPPKVIVQEFNSFLDGVSPFEQLGGGAQFDRIIVMVVDAMRSDFMYGPDSSMNFLHSLIESGNAIPFTAFSNPPTVTLPRLKGITTGGTPSFIDAILNVADDKDDSQSLVNADTWIHQFKSMAGGRRIHFFGDDTWLKLFPPSEFFEAFEGTSSFFVSDYTEVDHNVTRHLGSELSNDDWDALILHYLGMDHIGHKGGPRSTLMRPKQAEMDDIVREIYLQRVEKSPSTLMVLMGDHGMNDAGNHGGSSDGETSPGLTLISSRFKDIRTGVKCPNGLKVEFDYFSPISQIDLVPTLAALLNFPIPKNNNGIIIPELLDLWKSNDSKRNVLFENGKQFLSLLGEKYSRTDPIFMRIVQNFETLQDDDLSLTDIIDFLKSTQELLTKSSTDYSYTEIFLGLILITVSVVAISIQVLKYMASSQMSKTNIILFPTLCLLYALHFHGSSLIEEEHQIWWFLVILNLVISSIARKFEGGRKLLACMFCIRLIKGWDDSGQKYTSPFTISSNLLRSPNLLWILVMTSYFVITGLLYAEGNWIELFGGKPDRRFKSDDIYSFGSFIVAYVSASLSFLFKMCQFYNDGNEIPWWLKFLLNFACESFGTHPADDQSTLQLMNIQISRLFMTTMFAMVVFRVVIGKLRGLNQYLITDLANVVTLILMHQSRVEIIPIFLVFTVLRFAYSLIFELDSQSNADLCLISISTFILCIQNLTFFSVGNTNLLATVDLSNAYNGIANFDLLLVAILTFVSNFATPIYWSLSGLKMLFEVGSLSSKSPIIKLTHSKVITHRRLILTKCLFILFFYSVSMLSLVGSCINLRYHLFIWSVFCPKLLYFSSWAILMNLGVDFIFGLGIVSLK